MQEIALGVLNNAVEHAREVYPGTVIETKLHSQGISFTFINGDKRLSTVIYWSGEDEDIITFIFKMTAAVNREGI